MTKVTNLTFQLQLRNVGLQKDVDLGRRLLRPFLDRNWDSFQKLSKLEFLLQEIDSSDIPHGRNKRARQRTSCRTGMSLNSFESAKTRNNSSMDMVGRKCWL